MSRKPSVTTKAKKTETSESPKVPLDLLSQIKVDIKHKNETQKKLTQAIKINDVTICTGPAGTGKSYIAIATALKLLKENKDKYDCILLLKSVTQLKDEVLPALPGDAMTKMHFQNMSFFDSLTQLLGDKTTGDLINDNKIKFDVIGSFRGRNLSGCIIILDETQNISHDNLKTILTRISENTKIILLGDPGQIDIDKKHESSLQKLVDKVKTKPMDGVEIVEFTEEDIIRHRLTSYFINLFKKEPIIVISPLAKQTNKTLFEKIILFIKSGFKMRN